MNMALLSAEMYVVVRSGGQPLKTLVELGAAMVK
jgi:hypothetical protein